MPALLVVLAVVLAVAAVAAERWIRGYATRVATDRLQAAMPGADVAVELRGSFAGLRVLVGQLPGARVHATTVPIREGTSELERLTSTYAASSWPGGAPTGG